MAPLIVAALTPFVKDLFANGLNMLGSAIVTKGKDYVEEKLGVQLPEEGKPIPPEKLAELRVLELEHEAKLQQITLERAKVDLEQFKAELDDVANARDREVKIATSADAPLLNKIISPVLALLVVGVGFVLLAFGEPDVRTAAAGLIASVLSFYFGTSVGSREKQQMIERLTK